MRSTVSSTVPSVWISRTISAKAAVPTAALGFTTARACAAVKGLAPSWEN